MKKTTFVFFILILITMNLFSQNLIWERMSYLDDTTRNFTGMEIIGYNNSQFLIGIAGAGSEIGYGFVGTYLMNSDGKFLWRRIIEKDKTLFYQLIHTTSNNIDLLASYSDIWSGFYFGRFYLNKITFNDQGQLVYDFLDTIKQTTVLYEPGPVILSNDEYLNFLLKNKDSILNVLVKRFNKNCYLIEENFYKMFSNEFIDTLLNNKGELRLFRVIKNNDDGYVMLFDVVMGHPPNYKRYPLIIKINRFFQKEWEKSYQFEDYRISGSILKQYNDGYLLAGRIQNKEIDSINYLLKLDKLGFIENIIKFSGNHYEDFITSLLVINNDIVVSGKFYKDSLFYLKYFFIDNNFNVKSEITVAKDKYARTIKDMIYRDNLLFSIGSLKSKLYVNALRNLPVTIPYTFNNENSNITISPNPAADYIEISTNAVIPAKAGISADIKIYDVLGVCVLTLPCHSCESRNLGKREEIPNQVGNDRTLLRIDVSGLAAGVYFVRVGEKVLKFVKI